MPDDALTHRALAHPLRHRLLMSLRGRPATVSQLARRLGVLKGNVAHHLKVLVDAGLVRPTEARHVRGGTEQYYEVAVAAIVTREGDRAATSAMLAAIAEQLAADPDDPMLHLRHVRLSASQAARLRAALEAIVADEPQARRGQPTYGVLVGLYRSG